MPKPTLAIPLPQLALIEAKGADADAFLQGQLSNDLRRLTASQAQLSTYNSPKGRMLAVLHLTRAGDSILLELHRSILESTLKRLRMYVLRSKVTLTEAAQFSMFGVAGPEAPALLAQLGLPAPAAPLECAWLQDTGVTRRIGEIPRYSILVPAAQAATWWTRLSALAAAAEPAQWQLLDIESGVPTVYAQTQDRFVAQMCNLDQLGGISFDKGCYTGQEIIARVHYRGAVKRHMSVLPLAGPAPAPGTRIDAGEVVDAAANPDGSSIALVVT